MKLRRIVWLVIIAASLLVVLSGCASRPYLDVGVGYRADGNEVYRKGEVSNPKDEPMGIVNVGTQWQNGNYCEWEHRSYILRGRPFNAEHELSSDVLYCAVRFGGK